MSYFWSESDDNIRQFADLLGTLPDSDLECLFSEDNHQIYSDIRNRSPSGIFDAVLDQTIEWARLFKSRAQSCSALIGKVSQTYDLGADPHLSGVPVLVETETGLYVYKPRPVDLDSYYNRLVEILIGYGLKFPPGILPVHTMSGYGFVGFISSRPRPVSLSEQDFQRVGTALAIVYALAGTDFHYENIIFSDNGLFLIDQEGLLQPILKKEGYSETASISVLNTGILPIRIKSGEAFDFDPSVLGSKKFAFSCSLEAAMISLVEGFRDGYDCILSNRYRLAEEPVYKAMAESRSRFIACQTIDYYRAMARHVRSPTCKALPLESSFLQSMRSTEGSDDPFLQHEKEALSLLCVPMFYHSNHESKILTENGEQVSVSVERSGFESSFTRITGSMSSEDMNRQVWFIKCSFECHALNSGCTMEITDDQLPVVQAEVPFLIALVSEFSAKVSDYLKVDRVGQRFAVVPVFDRGHWRLRNQRLDERECEIFSYIEKLAADLVKYFRCGDDPELLDICEVGINSAIKGIRLQGPIEREIVGFPIANELDPCESIVVSIERGPCSSILQAFAEHGGLDRPSCIDFVSAFKLAQARGMVRYGGIFSVPCLYLSFGLPLMITTLCVILFTLFRSRDELPKCAT